MNNLIDFIPLPLYAQIPEEAGATASCWLNWYTAFSRYWSPQSYDGFHEATALWLLATIAARRVCLFFGKFYYTPLFIALTARTSLYAKSTVADIAVEVLRTLGLDWLLASDDSTPQKFIADLTATLPANYEQLPLDVQQRFKQRLARAGQRGWFYEEFGQHIVAMTRENSPTRIFMALSDALTTANPVMSALP